MAKDVQEIREQKIEGDGTTTRTKTISSDGAPPGGSITAERVVYLLLGILEAILAIRVVLSLLGANPDNPFASFIYNISAIFVAPFFGLFGYQFTYGVARLEIETLVGMAVYALIAWGIVKALSLRRPAD